MRDRDRATGGYAGSIAAWRAERVRQYAVAIGDLGEHETGAFLAWGDATLYDPTLAVLEEVRATWRARVLSRGDSRYQQRLRAGGAARHRGHLGGRHTPGHHRSPHCRRRVAARRRCRRRARRHPRHDRAWTDDDAEIYWGAFVGLATEQLIHGRVGDQRGDRTGTGGVAGRARVAVRHVSGAAPRPPMKVLLLAGTSEARAAASLLAAEPDVEVVASLAGRTSQPAAMPCAVRTGGFGDVEGLTAYLRQSAVDAIVDATHAFAAVMPHHVARAGGRRGPAMRALAASTLGCRTG